MWELVACEDCGGTGADSGALYEPEPCPACQGSGKEQIQTSPSSSLYGKRKPMGSALLAPTAGEIEERRGQYGD